METESKDSKLKKCDEDARRLFFCLFDDCLFNKQLSWGLVVSESSDAQVAESGQQLESGIHWETHSVGSGLLMGRDCLVHVCDLSP